MRRDEVRSELCHAPLVCLEKVRDHRIYSTLGRIVSTPAVDMDGITDHIELESQPPQALIIIFSRRAYMVSAST